MASVIRLLPRKKIERDTLPYVDLLGSIMKKRFYQAFRTVTYLCCIVILILSVFARGSLTLGRTMSLFYCYSTMLVMYKVVLRSQPLLCSSIFTEVCAKLLSPLSYATLLLHLLSGYFYFKSPLVAKMELYVTKVAEPSKLPEGIPASLALHRTDKWLLINEKFTYMLTFIALLATLNSVIFIARNQNVLRLDPRENGQPLIQRLRNRLQSGYMQTFLSWALCYFVCPLIYFTLGRSVSLTAAHHLLFNKSAQSVIELSGFNLSSLLFPVCAIPLCLFWHFSYQTFMTYSALGPLHRGKTVSSFVISDKNGTLVDGLGRDPGHLSGLIAWYELLVIAEHDGDRRKSIYNDVDGERVIWEHIHQNFQALIDGHIKKLAPKDAKSKAHSLAKHKASQNTASMTVTAFLQSLTGTNAADILRSSTTKSEEKNTKDASGVNPSIFKQSSAFSRKLSSISKNLEFSSTSRAERARGRLLKFAHRLRKIADSSIAKLLATKFGMVFRRTVKRSLDMKIHHPQTTSFALHAIARMVTRSLHEDELGYVQSTIAPTLASLDALATQLETLCRNPPVDWTDVLVKAGSEKPDSNPASLFAAEVTNSFAEIFEVFEPYMDNLQITDSVRSRARKLSSRYGIANIKTST